MTGLSTEKFKKIQRKIRFGISEIKLKVQDSIPPLCEGISGAGTRDEVGFGFLASLV